MSRRIFAVMALALALLLALASAGHAQGPTLPVLQLSSLPPAPWQSGDGVWAAGATEEEPEFLEVPVADDTFVAGTYPYTWVNFAKQTSVWFGHDNDLGEMRALLRWALPPKPFGYLGAAVYLPIVGKDGGDTLTARAYTIMGGWQEPTWTNQPLVHDLALAEFTIGSEAKWYWFDVTSLVAGWYLQGTGMPYIPNQGVEIRGVEAPIKATRGMWSQEAGGGEEKPTATLVIAYRPDRVPPTCTINPLEPVSPSPVVLHFRCNDTQSGIGQIEIQSRDNGGPWQTIGTRQGDLADFNVPDRFGGHSYEFRVRGRDNSNNVSPWTPDGASVTTIESVPPEINILGALAWIKISAAASSLETSLFSPGDPGPVSSGIRTLEREYADVDDGVWRPVTRWSDATLSPGRRYVFRLRAVDNAWNQGAWTALGPAVAYVQTATGQIRDARGAPLANLPLITTPYALNSLTTDQEGRYQAYLAETQSHTLTIRLPGYEVTGNTQIHGGAADALGLLHTVRSIPEVIVNGGFASPLLGGAWSVQGSAERQAESMFSTNFGLGMGARPEEILAPAPISFPPCLALGPDGSQHLFWFQAHATDRELVQANYTRRLAGRLDWEPIEDLGTSRLQALSNAFPRCLLGVASDGTVHLIFNDFRSNTNHWVHRVRTPVGGWQTEESLPTRYPIPIAMLIDSAGTLHLFYDTYCADVNCSKIIPSSLYHAEWRPDQGWRSGTLVGPQGQSSNQASYGFRDEVQFIIGNEGMYHVIWTDRTDLWNSRIVYSMSRDGRAWSAPLEISAPQTSNHRRISLVQAPNSDLYALWISYADHWRLYYARRHMGLWETLHEVKLQGFSGESSEYAAQIDPSGVWQLVVQGTQQAAWFSGVDLDALSARMSLSDSVYELALATDSQASYLVRMRPAWISGLSESSASLLIVPHNQVAATASISQALRVPSNATPVLTWWSQAGHLSNSSSGGKLVVDLTDASGNWHPLESRPSGTTDTGSLGVAELATWRGQVVTVTFRFDPQADPTAWVRLDDIHLGGVPLDAGVGLVRSNQPEAGSPFRFTLTATNRRSMSVTVPIEVTWPGGWLLAGASVPPASSSPGTARFEIPIAAGGTAPVDLNLAIPPGAPRAAQTITARLLEPIAAEDYTPADNQAELTVIVDGVPGWLPLIIR